MSAPLVSVVMATYNHAHFVAQAIQSVLQQQNVALEFLIADDGSTDGTACAVASVQDSRIRFTAHHVNRGACVVTNELIAQAQGEFIALINSDDRWIGPDKLATQVQLLRTRTELAATFGRARYIDRQGNPIPKNTLPFGTVFDHNDRSQGQWLRHFFETGNGLCHPTVLIRRQCYSTLGMYNNTFRQLPDLDMWIRLLKRYPIHVASDEWVEFRVLPGENVSSGTADNVIRTLNEHYLLGQSFFDGVDANLLKDGFGDMLRHKDIPTEIHLEIEKVLLLLSVPGPLARSYRLHGLFKLGQLLNQEAHREVLAHSYQIDANWFHAKMAATDILRPRVLALLGQYGVSLKRILNWPRLSKR